jgi:hypothetical protein
LREETARTVGGVLFAFCQQTEMAFHRSAMAAHGLARKQDSKGFVPSTNQTNRRVNDLRRQRCRCCDRDARNARHGPAGASARVFTITANGLQGLVGYKSGGRDARA